jgi:hypothetical protein
MRPSRTALLHRQLLSALLAILALVASGSLAWWHGRAAADTPPAEAATSVRQEAGSWIIDAETAPRLALARRLAAATGTQLLDQPELLSRTTPVTLHWRGQDIHEAWAQLLASDVSYALQCRPGGCRLWVMAVAASANR